MSWDEFCTLLAGILPETPLGKTVSIRSENDKDMLKNFTREQHKIRNDWRSRKRDVPKDRSGVKAFQEMCKIAFGKGGD